MQILVLMAGTNAFFPVDTYPFPKPLIEVGGIPMIRRVIENLQSVQRGGCHFIFVIRREDAARFSLDRTLKLLAGENCTVFQLDNPTQGALCSALMAIDVVKAHEPLIIANADQIIDADLDDVTQRFWDSGAEGGCITFDSVHPRWSYALLQGSDVVQTAEKLVISRAAIAGLYYFRAAETFFRAARNTILNGTMTDGAYYISPVLNELILDGRKVVATSIEALQYHSFYSPSKIEEFEEFLLGKKLEHEISVRKSSAKAVQVVIPAAGEGSRFRVAGFEKPKPFIDVNGQPMITRVLANVLPNGAMATLLLRSEHVDQESEAISRLLAMGHKVHRVDKLTEGTLCTLLLARKEFDNEQPLLVANSDQLVDFDVSSFVEDSIRRALDGSILVFREPSRDKKWSYAKLNAEGLVDQVAEKLAISDLATVGIYLFKNGSDFVRAAIDMIARNERVNGEFYTCPVYNYMIRQGARIGVFEIDRASMHGLGTPKDLEIYLEQMDDKSQMTK